MSLATLACWGYYQILNIGLHLCFYGISYICRNMPLFSLLLFIIYQYHSYIIIYVIIIYHHLFYDLLHHVVVYINLCIPLFFVSMSASSRLHEIFLAFLRKHCFLIKTKFISFSSIQNFTFLFSSLLCFVFVIYKFSLDKPLVEMFPP